MVIKMMTRPRTTSIDSRRLRGVMGDKTVWVIEDSRATAGRLRAGDRRLDRSPAGPAARRPGGGCHAALLDQPARVRPLFTIAHGEAAWTIGAREVFVTTPGQRHRYI